ncbi:ATP-dependent helicase [Gordonia neofelifaecis]|uniref:DNA 3'-5' helicase n=1 Tax=Gordonia neofelifaecis NRRL B-59395 TaxID=644548 RepID=F1YJL2_9ACTN|nr:ATP-dependent DNA helicase [Gordonia neofelifaecis]EGD55245.1 UvrD/REP helicase [Gordonia neofelifaecis NRRL B-59395]
MTRPGTRLIAGQAPADAPRSWPADVAVLVGGPHRVDPMRPWRPWRVHGGPGTGKTSLIVDTAVARLLDPGVDPESVLVLAANRRAATQLRAEITRRVLSAGGSLGGALREPLVRTVHSYAFAVLRLQASAHGNPPPRLITGSEQDVILRELLAGDVEDGADYWPASLRPALTTDGFAQALRDLMMRAAERGLGPQDLAELGRTHDRPEWVAAGHAFRQYEEGMLLRGAVGLDAPEASVTAVDAAELIGSALSAFATDPDVLAGQRQRIRHVLVDDAQHLDPQAASLIRLIGTGADSTVVASDTDQSVFGFRGADPRFANAVADDDPDRDILLENDFRGSPAVNAVGRALALRLPGARPHRYPTAAEPDDPEHRGHADVRVFSSAAKEATAVADMMRRAHLFDGVPWSEMAVIVRSVPRALPAIRRAFSSAGVPMATPATDIPIHRQRAVAAFSLVLRVAGGGPPLDADEVTALLTGPVGAADPTNLRRLRRGIRRIDEARGREADSLDSLARALDDPELMGTYLGGLTDFEAIALKQVRKVVDAARTAHTAGVGVEETLWRAWSASGLERRWTAQSLRGGRGGDQADRDMDAMLAMFEAAGTFADNLPAAGVLGFVDYLGQLQIPRESRVAVSGVESVAVVSAHAAAGREWDVVAVPGVLDGLWPSLRSRGSVLHTPALIDLLSGVGADAVDTVARGAVMLADERRLLLVACTRARSRLLVTAIEDGSGDASPSRFVPEIAEALGGYGATEPESADEIPLDPGVRRVLSLPSLVAELRAVAVAGADASGGPDERTRVAAALLADLAQAGVSGAAPADWFGLVGPSTEVPLWTPENGPRTLSPSNVDALTKCSLRWMLERHGGRDGDAEQAVTGTLVHTLVQAVAGNLDRTEVNAALHEVWERVSSPAQWYSARELERAEGMLTNFRDWLRISREDLTAAGVEVEVDATLPTGVDDHGNALLPVRLVGRMDRLETDSRGRPVVVDVKTGKNPVRAVDAEVHPQLATYQLALRLGGVTGLGSTEPGGGRLVYVASANKKTGAAQRVQPPLTPEQVDEWISVVREAARASVGPVFTATPNSGCSHCSLVQSCPAQLRGKAVIDD